MGRLYFYMYFYLYDTISPDTPADCCKLYNRFSLIDAVNIPIEVVNESLIINMNPDRIG